jgi:O-antigen/teichoic acid export membrane protein
LLASGRMAAVPGRRSMSANALFALLAQVGSSAFAAAETLFLVRALSVHAYGALGLAAAISGLVLLPADFGLIQSTSRFAAEQHADPAEVSRLVAASVRLKLFTTGTVCAGLFAVAGPTSSAWGKPDLAWPLRALALAAFAQSLMTLLGGVFNAVGRTDRNVRVLLGENAVETSVVIVLVLVFGGATAAAAGRAIGFAVGALIAVVTLVQLLGVRALDVRRVRRDWSRRLLRYGGAVLIVDSTYALFSQIDVLLIGVIISTTATGLYVAPFRILTLLILPVTAIVTAVAPRLAVPAAGGDVDRRAPFVQATRLIAVWQGLLVAPLLVWPAPIVDVALGGAAYARSISVLRAFALYVFLSGFGLFFSVAANYLGQARRRIPIAIATVVVNVVLDVVLLPSVGVVGGAVSSGVAFALYAPAHAVICARMLGVRWQVFGAVLARVVPCVVLMGLVLLAFGTHPRGLAVAVGAVCALAAYGLVALVTGALRGDDLRHVRRLTARTAR